jgi:hypothetical protein
MILLEQKLYIAGRIIIPVYLPIDTKDKFNQFVRVKREINSNTVKLINADLHTIDNKELYLVASKCKVDWLEIVDEDEVI